MNRLLPLLPPKSNPPILQKKPSLTLQKVSWVEAMMVTLKKGYRATIPLPKHRSLPGDLGKYVKQDTDMGVRMGWEIFVAGSLGRVYLTYLGGCGTLGPTYHPPVLAPERPVCDVR